VETRSSEGEGINMNGGGNFMKAEGRISKSDWININAEANFVRVVVNFTDAII
jgi:hypothetical protein